MELLEPRELLQVTQLPENYKDLFHEGSKEEYRHAISLATQSVSEFLNNNRKPFSGIRPAEIQALVEAVDLDQPVACYETLLTEIERLYIKHATAFHLPQYIAHLNCPVVIPALAAEVLISAINSSQDTYDQSAGGTFIERKLIDWTNRQIGYSDASDGVFTSGGSQSNLMGLLLARDDHALEKLNYSIRKKGINADVHRYRIFASEHAHFSNKKNACVLGLGEQSVITIPTDERYRMDVPALKAAIQNEKDRGNIPFVIVATAGTTDFGNIDPLEEIAAVARAFGLWMHVDAAYGCGLLLTDRHRHLLNGIEQADSVTVDYHKSFFQPVSSSALVVKNKKHLQLVKHHADYLNPAEEEALPAQVDKSILQTTRRFDALKLWCTLRYLGREQLGAYTDKLIETAKGAATLIEADPHFELLCDSDMGVLLFRFVQNHRTVRDLNRINKEIKSALFYSGEIMVAGTRVNGLFYLKFTLLNPLTSLSDIAIILKKIKEYGKQICE